MTSHIYTLNELVDLALQTPDIGVVNFNILRVVLHKILSECKIGKVTAEWKPVEITTTPVSEVDRELPVHPIRGRFKTKVVKEQTPKTQKGVMERTLEEIAGERQGGKETTDFEISAESEKSGGESSSEKAKAQIPKKKVKASADDETKEKKFGSGLWQMWQVKKLTTRLEAVEEEVNNLVDTVDELVEFKDSKLKRTMFEEGEKYESGYSGANVYRQEFEEVIEELGEALVRVTTNQRQQKEECVVASQKLLKELSAKASEEDIKECNETLGRKLKTLGVSVKDIQKLIKDNIYPESCGITKCMACNRKAHAPLRCMIVDARKTHSTHKEADEGLKERSHTKQESETPPELKYTNICLRRTTLKDIQQQREAKRSQKAPGEVQIHQERPLHPDYLKGLDNFLDVSTVSRNFAPLRVFQDLTRQNTVYVPTNAEGQLPSLITDGTKGRYISTRSKV